MGINSFLVIISSQKYAGPGLLLFPYGSIDKSCFLICNYLSPQNSKQSEAVEASADPVAPPEEEEPAKAEDSSKEEKSSEAETEDKKADDCEETKDEEIKDPVSSFVFEQGEYIEGATFPG